VIQQTAEQLVANNVVQCELIAGQWWRQFGVDGHITESLMGTELVVVGYPLREDIPQVRLAKDNEMI
jgi:hypothetical protein